MTCWLCGSKTTNLVTRARVPRCKNGPCQACIDVENVDEEINQAMATLRRLLVKRCDLRSEQNRVHDSLIHRLPLEIKNYIFELLLPSRNKWGTATNSVTMPLYMTPICRGWRDIAWSNPFLWSTIQIQLGKKSSVSDPHSRINFVHEWILRSGTMPLTLHIVVHEIKGFEEESKAVIDAISQCSNRWHSLSLDIPSNELSAFQHNNFQCRLLKGLRIISREGRLKGPVPFLNLEVSPEAIEIRNVPFQSLQISWNHLSSANIEYFSVEEIIQLFQHALQMTYCRISSPNYVRDPPMPPITHRRLKTLILDCRFHTDAGVMLLRSLTLPRLQDFSTDEMALLAPVSLPALAQGSSRPLTRITLRFLGHLTSGNLQPLAGVTDLYLDFQVGHDGFMQLLLEGNLPDLRCLTLDVYYFWYLWQCHGTIRMLLGREPRTDVEEKPRYLKISVIDTNLTGKSNASLWTSLTEQLKSLKPNMRLREDGFELLIPR